MLTMMREFTVKEVDRRIIECDSIRLTFPRFIILFIAHCVVFHSSRLPAGSEVQKEWLLYKENMKATAEQYKVYFTISVIT